MAVATVSIRTARQHRNFNQLKKRVSSNAHRAGYNFARGVVKEARLRVAVDTGYLKSQIKWERVKPGTFDVFVDGDIKLNTGAFYGVYIEYGTRNMAAQPFFRPAIEVTKLQWSAEMKAVFK